MTRKEQHKARKRANKGRYIYGSLGTFHIAATHRLFMIAWQRFKSVSESFVIVEED
jgi:hypothetical protein